MSLKSTIKELEQLNSDLEVSINHYEHKDLVVADFDLGGMFCTYCEVHV